MTWISNIMYMSWSYLCSVVRDERLFVLLKLVEFFIINFLFIESPHHQLWIT